MTKKQKVDEKTCWACKRIIAGKAKFGLCSDCLNKYGTPAVALAALGVGVGVKAVAKNGGKITNVAENIIKNIKA